MKAQIIAIITGAVAASVFAGGLNTNTNQSIAYQRHVMRYATTDNDAPIFNPAGTAFMEDGWHVSLNSQAFWQTRTIYTESPLFDETQPEMAYGLRIDSPRRPEDLVIDKENTQTLFQSVFNALSKYEQQVLRCYLNGMSYREIAEMTNRTEKTVDNAIQRIRHKVSQLH